MRVFPVGKTTYRYALSLLLVFGAVFGATSLSNLLSSTSIPLFALRPQVGIIASALILSPRRWTLPILAASFLGLYLPEYRGTAFPAPVFAGVSLIEATVFAFAIKRLCGRIALDETRHIVYIVFLSNIVASAVVAVAAIFPASAGKAVYWEFARAWSMSDALGIILVVPFCVGLFGGRRPMEDSNRLEAIAFLLLAALIGSLWFIPISSVMKFFPSKVFYIFVVLSSPLPFLLWAGSRLDTFGTAAASLLLFGCAVIGTAAGKGPIPEFSSGPDERMVLVRLYAIWLSILPLISASSIERRKRTEKSLFASERRLKLIIESINDAVLVLNAEGVVTFASPAFERLTGLSEGKAVGASFRDLVIPGENRDILEALDRILVEKAMVKNLVLKMRKSDGAVLVAETMGLNLLDDKAVGGILLTIHDLTERAAIEDELMVMNSELEEANQSAETAREVAENALQAKGVFLSNMSHELRTPLTGVLGMTTLLSRSPLSEGQKAYVDRLRTSGKLLLGIVDDILDVEKMEQGALSARPEPTDVPALCAAVLDEHEATARDKDLSLESSLSFPCPRLIVDPKLLRGIVSNLVDNAIKFTKAGKVRLEASAARGEGAKANLRIAVSDTGIGIAPSGAEAIFERFYQVDSSYSKHQKGTGLGLHIVKRSVELLGGSIAVKSELDAGAAFVVEIPCPIAEAADEGGGLNAANR